MTRGWPFPGDAPVVRARKVALAYRAIAQDQAQQLKAYKDILSKLDRRLLLYDDRQAAARLHALVEHTNDTQVEELDQRFADWGQTWHADIPMSYDLDDTVPARIAAELLCIAPGTLGRLRANGRIKGEFRGRADGFWYRVRDVYALSSEVRGRATAKTVQPADTTDSIHD